MLLSIIQTQLQIQVSLHSQDFQYHMKGFFESVKKLSLNLSSIITGNKNGARQSYRISKKASLRTFEHSNKQRRAPCIK